MANMGIFRILADISHTASKCILIWAIHMNKSAEGVSLLTQWLYTIVFCTRYLDLFWVAPYYNWWNTLLKIFYISSSFYIVWIMMRVYARTREKEYAWKLATWSLGASLVSAPIVCLIFRQVKGTTLFEVNWTFSLELESVCVLPQLLLLRQTTVPTVIDSFYLVTLGSYRFLYLLNWIMKLAVDHEFDPISVIFGLIQTALYVDFAWVYYSRQRVKLRAGGVVDSDDLSKSLIVRRIIGAGSRADREDDDGPNDVERGPGHENGSVRAPHSARNWGERGISVSADDTLPERQKGAQGGYADSAADADAQMIDPAHFEDDGADDDDADMPPPPVAKDARYTSVSPSEDETAWASNTGHHS